MGVRGTARRVWRVAASGGTLPLWSLAVLCAWFGAPGNPRDGWSLARRWARSSGPSPSGDDAYWFARSVRFVLARDADGAVRVTGVALGGGGSGAYDVVEPLARRSRFGLFAPWVEREDLRLVSYTRPRPGWVTGSADPEWGVVVRAVRDALAASDEAWAVRIRGRVDDELGGRLPSVRVVWGGLAAELLLVGANAMFVATVVCVARRGLDASRRRRWVEQGRCAGCGYDLRDGARDEAGDPAMVCPECGAAGAG